LRLTTLLPQLAGLRVERVLLADDALHVEVRRGAAAAYCPTCGRRSRRIHSAYSRRIADEPIGGRRVIIYFCARRFRCVNRACLRQTFVEQAPRLAARYARRSVALRVALQQIALALGGRAGARLSQRLIKPASRMTLLRLVRALPEPSLATPRVLGVDEFAKRRGRTYATLLVDMEARRPIDVLEERSAETFAAWLVAHPRVEIICRDRAGAYADGATRGAPEATQVADRWHLLRNLGDAVERVLVRHRADLQDTSAGEAVSGPATIPSTPSAAPIASRLVVRVHERHARVHDLLARGATITTIARSLHLDRKTVRRYARASTAAALVGARRGRPRGLLAPHTAYLDRRWSDGCTDGARLYQELRDLGYRGSARTVRRYLTARRAGAPAYLGPAPVSPTRSSG
jgi:transposase